MSRKDNFPKILLLSVLAGVAALVLWSRVEFCSVVYPMVNPLVCAIGMAR